MLAVVVTRDDDVLAADSPLSEDITRAIGSSERVDLPELAPFGWDEVLVVERGTPASAISDRLGYAWEADLGFQAGELLLFVRDGRVERFADYRGLGRFEGFETPIDAVPREDAVFRVRDLVVSPDHGQAG